MVIEENTGANEINFTNSSISSSDVESNFHKLTSEWTLWAHLPHNTDWSINSYINIFNFNYVEEAIALSETLPSILVENCMLFLMKKGIKPVWEDPRNRTGGSFSYKIPNKTVTTVWKELTYAIVGNSISNDQEFVSCINGITISPKKNFCIIKIWLANCKFQNPSSVSCNIKGLSNQGCIFKKHIPEY